ncbi:type I methionyl aminopeptidase [Candidatus Magnetaquicoccus inordinatus]|uniref:type I methionyl aminopeptidase n=1 Tax=Candidatus Magnetaquicoccus inordinatus TaxID=2496818 RepID=UPI00102C3E77|nr:type I methionyl aminopeptidase [Candidatus Magnetaquicoccus inordinatus]
MIIIKTAKEIERMRLSCRLAAQTLNMIAPHVQPGVSTNALNDLCHQFILDHGATPSPLHYRPSAHNPQGFPKSICTSVNQQVCHGIPGPRVLREGDIINVDITVCLQGFHGDTSKTFFVGPPTPRNSKIVRVAEECLAIGIAAAQPGNHFNAIGNAIEPHARLHRCSVVREYCGHGIGRSFHEEPAVLHYASRDKGAKLLPGMIFTIEPMINMGKPEIRILADHWTVVTKDHSLSAQFEHTILITPHGNEILTVAEEEAVATNA